MSAPALQQDLLAAAVTALPADKLSVVRDAALASFTASGWPTKNDEDWKYTSLAGAAAISNAWLQDMANASRPDGAAVDTGITEQVDAYWLSIKNGMVDPESLRRLDSLAAQGITISRLADGIGEDAIARDDPMSAFNAALLQDGLLIRAASGARLDKPIGIVLADDGSVAVTQFRVLLEIGENAKLQLVECSLSGGNDEQFQNSVMQVMLSAGAALDVVRMQQRQSEHLSVNRVAARLAHDAVFDYSGFDFGGRLARNDIVADIVGEGAVVKLRGLYLAGGRQHIDNHTRVDHRVGPATSSEDYRGILSGRSRCVFNGKAIVHPGADGTDADQSNHNLLLSEKAEIDTKPELEIYADDVKCSHGATVGQLDQSAIFYLRSRGLDESQATQFLTRAFASTIADRLPIACCHQYLVSAMDAKLDALISEDTP